MPKDIQLAKQLLEIETTYKTPEIITGVGGTMERERDARAAAAAANQQCGRNMNGGRGDNRSSSRKKNSDDSPDEDDDTGGKGGNPIAGCSGVSSK